MPAEGYLQELSQERGTLDPIRYGHAMRLLEEEMFRVGGNAEQPRSFPRAENEIPGDSPLEVYPPYKEEMVKLEEKVKLPVEEFPKYNFIGRLLGPKGSIMKSITESTKTKIKILGRGSMKDKAKEEELSKSEAKKHEHLKEPLHVVVLVEGPKSECHARLANALEEIKNAISYEDDEQMNEHMGEMGPMHGFNQDIEMHMGRGSYPETRYGGPSDGRIYDDKSRGGRGQRHAGVTRNFAPRDY